MAQHKDAENNEIEVGDFQANIKRAVQHTESIDAEGYDIEAENESLHIAAPYLSVHDSSSRTTNQNYRSHPTFRARNNGTITTARHIMKERTTVCPFCKAKMWMEEKVRSSSMRQPKFSICCSGKFKLRPYNIPPTWLIDLVSGNSAESREFKKNIRSYNNALSFTSVGAKIDERLLSTGGIYTFRLHGEFYHLMGSLLPQGNVAPKFSQIYIYDTERELENRLNYNRNLNPQLLQRLQEMINEVNPFAQSFKTVSERIQQTPAVDLKMVIKSPTEEDRRRYNRPTSSEVAIIYPDNPVDISQRDIVLASRTGTFQRISDLHPAYMPLHYVLLFPLGDEGWHPLLVDDANGIEITQMEYYAYRLMERDDESNFLHHGGRLFQQFVVDAFACVDQNRLNFLKFNQQTIRAELYRGLQDALLEDANQGTSAIGQRIILPSSFIGSPRNMMQLYQDSMAIVRKFGKPDLFVTFTCNPKWPEIENELGEFQQANDRPDIVVRVFKMKLKELLNDILEKDVLGKVVAHIYVVEFQKRGLPHAHMLFILDNESKPQVDEYDMLVSAELPDHTINPLAYETVTKCLIHGPCGTINRNSSCMVDGKCSKGYPKQFIEVTSAAANGYPVYRRRNNGRTFTTSKNIVVDNRWIVPHNLYLTTKFNAHINVEICSSVTAIKYLFKYVYKGGDRATIEINQGTVETVTNSSGNIAEITNQQRPSETIDEIKQFLDGRYLAAPEACWRLFHFSLHKEAPSVTRLQVHLENMQMVTFQENQAIGEVLQSEILQKTTLTEYFVANQRSELARTVLYPDFPQSFVWNKSRKMWTVRQGKVSIGRMVFVHANAGERFYLRMLLNNVRGARSFQELRTVDGEICSTNKEACYRLGLLEDDSEWITALQEASLMQLGYQLRHLFATILLFGEPVNPRTLWEHFKNDLCDDLIRQHPDIEAAYNIGLYEINIHLSRNGRSLRDFPQMPDFYRVEIENRTIQEERYLNTEELSNSAERYKTLMNRDQKIIFDKVTTAVEAGLPKVFFIDGPGGTGKTFVYESILAEVRSKRKIALAVASSGIAALLLTGGRTAHSRFKIPVDVHEGSTCSISKQSDLAKLLIDSSLIIWDEAPMMNRFCYEALDRTLRDLTGSNHCFGGKIVVLGGDFRQILPVVQKAGREKAVDACIKRSELWSKVEVLKLTINMRVNVSDTSADFTSWLLKMGEGKLPENDFGEIRIPPELLITPSTLTALIDFVFPDVANNFENPAYFSSRCILAPTNDNIDEINSLLLNKIPGHPQVFLSADSLAENETHQQALYPQEFLNSLSPNGLPLHELKLKVGVPVLLLRNLDPANGLCNGTRMTITRFNGRIIEAVISTGKFTGKYVFIPRITLSPSLELPFTLKRRQFPIRLAFAMTINKSQGQTLSNVGLYLPSSIFSHGQLYVACSRVTSKENLKIFVPGKSTTKNLVYQEIL